MRLGTLRNDRGSAFVELALVLPILTLVLIGAAELGRMVYFAIEVSDAARAGVAYGVQNSGDATNQTEIAAAAVAAAPDLPSTLTVTSSVPCVCENIANGVLTSTSYTADICGNETSLLAVCPTTPASGVNVQAMYVQVSTSATVSTMLHYPGIPTSFTLTGFSKMRVLE